MKKFIMVAIAATALLSACNKKGGEATATLANETDTLSYAYGLASGPNAEMLKGAFQQYGADTTAIAAFEKGLKEGLNTKFDPQTRAYYLGYSQGLQMAMTDAPQIEKFAFAGDSLKHLNMNLVYQGMKDALNEKSALNVTTTVLGKTETKNIAAGQEAGMYFQQYIMDMCRKSNEDFMANIAKRSDLKPLEGGVYYKEIKAGKGAVPTISSTVKVDYEGRFINGTVFDSSMQRGVPAEFPVNGVIPGWITALTHMPVGSEWEVYIPWQQAYGEQGMGRDIPPYSALVFKMKLIEIQ